MSECADRTPEQSDLRDEPHQPDTQQHTLRDRIAQVVYDHPNALSGVQCVELADAVIAALGLKKDSEMALDDDYRVVPMHRYVTEWTDGI